MSLLNFLFLLSLFLLISSLSYWVLNQWMPSELEERRMRLTQQAPATASPWLKGFIQRFTAFLVLLGPWSGQVKLNAPVHTSDFQIRLLNAGLRSPLALPLFLGSKTLLTVFFPGIFMLFAWVFPTQTEGLQFWTSMIVAASLGYYLPNVVLHHWVQKQQKIMFHALPDALDLMRLCVQAGLGLDAALDRVGREMRRSYPELSDEFALTGLELRAGSSRADALRHLSQRMGLADMDGLVSMLIQSDRFGTSVAESLEVHSDALRSKRRLIAEETAAKLPIKLLIPLIFCVFPALMTVLLGPVVISISQQLFPLINN
jgi:tight adherence protein C